MLLTSIKWLVFAAVILLAGQIPIGPTKIGEKFYGVVRQGVSWSGNEIRGTKVYASLAGSSVLSRWFNNVYPPEEAAKPPAEPTAPAEIAADTAGVDTFTSTDRESILRLLD